MVTNDGGYLNRHPNSCAKDIYPTNGKQVALGDQIDWDRSRANGFWYNTWRDMALDFSKRYECKWSKVTNIDNIEFNYLILETN